MPRLLLTLVALAFAAAAGPAAQASGDSWFPVSVESRQPPFSPHGLLTRVEYVPGEGASRRWRLCAALPGLQFSYVQALAHGMREEARRRGVELRLEDAGGFDVDRQQAQLEACLAAGADALLVVAAADDVLAPVLARALGEGVKVIDVATGSGSMDVTAKIVVDARRVGYEVGRYLADRHPLGGDRAFVAWLPGPIDSSFAHGYDDGFREAAAGGALSVVHGSFTPLDEAALTRAVRSILDGTDELDAIAGVGPVALAAMDELGPAASDVALVSTGINARIVSAIEAGRVAAAINDKPVTQGRIAVDLALRALEGEPFMAELRPTLEIIDASNVGTFDRTTALAPAD